MPRALAAVAACCLVAAGLFAADADPRAKGLRRPGERERAARLRDMVRVRGVRPNRLGLERINAARRSRGLATYDLLGAAPTGEEVVADAAGETTASDSQRLLAESAARDLPSSVDNSALDFFPPIRSQGWINSCAAFSTTYYQMTHMVGLARGAWNAKTGGEGYRFSPRWTYNMVNDGADLGAYFTDVYEVLLKHGCATWSELPYDGLDYLSWCLDGDVWRGAISFRMNSSGYVTGVSTADGLAQLKALLNNGYVLVFGTDIDSWHTGTISDDPATPGVDPETGKTVCLWVDDTEQGGHAMTVVGYDDTVWCDVNANGVVDAGEKGALRIANSWGDSYEDGGFVWFAYDALKGRSSVPGAPNAGRTSGWWYDEALYITARASYTPKMVAEFSVSHALREEMAVRLGVSDPTRTTPSAYWTPGALQNAGGPYALDGSAGEAVQGTFVFDLSELAVYGAARRYYVSVMDGWRLAPATLYSFKLVDVYARTEVVSTNTFPKTADASAAHAWVDYTFSSHSQRPYCSLSSPSDGQVFPATAQVPISATASDPDGTVVRVEFYSGAGKIGEDTTGSDGWGMMWSPPAGVHTLTARAVDDSGDATTSAQVTITVDLPPSVSITAPASGAEFVEGEPVAISASASDPDGVALVEFYEGTNKLGEDGASPWEFVWTSPPAGTYTLTARATDTYGASSVSEPVSITVAADSDADGMPDYWEDLHGLDKDSASDAGEDPDSDGLANLDEYRHRTSPQDPDSDDDGLTDGYEVSNSLTDPADPDTDGDLLPDGEEVALGTNPLQGDTDGDGMTDGWEVSFGLDPLADDAHADPDGDGFSNYAEFAAGTDPRDAGSHPPASGGSDGTSCAQPAGGVAWPAALALAAWALGKARRRGSSAAGVARP